MKVKYHHKVIAIFLALNIMQSVLPYNLLYASNNGPNAPEAAGFESVNATDMVNLASGDMAYVLPVMDVGGFPVSLSYHGGIPLDLESTWTGLGWNLNTGAINRSLNATPDDWKGGNSLDFIRYEDSETITSINVGVGIYKAAEVGIGASMSSNKGLSGSVFASIGLGDYASASASIDTNGNYSLGVGAGTGKKGEQSFGGGMSVSGNVNGGGLSVGVGVGVRTAGGMTVGLGASLDGGMSASLGFSDASGSGHDAKGQSGAGSISVSSFSSGDWDISSKGWYIPAQIGFISFGFGQQKITYSLKKAYNKQGYGILYANEDIANSNNDAVEPDNGVDNQFSDYQNRFRYIDSYDQSLPVSEKEFIGDYDAEREKLNFTFAGYDSYDVNATGISGIMTPKVLQNATLFGLGFIGPNPQSTNEGKLRVYNHNSLTTTKTFGTSNPNNIEFYFNGQFTQNKAIAPLSPINNNTSFLQSMLSPRPALNNDRLKQGNYVEVFTNQQIRQGNAPGLLSPLNPNSDGQALEPLDRLAPEYKNEGIGGYKVTSPDGKTYHFSQPVYQFEEVDRDILKDTTEHHVSEKRQYTSYATHWVLTAITGPDFIDTNNNNIADSEDYGYWIRMDYGKWSDGYVWRTPTDKNLKDYHTNIESNVGESDFGNYQFGRKQLYYLDRIVSATHTAYFVKDLRYDSVGSDLTYDYTQQVTSIGSPTGLADVPFSNDGTGNGSPIYPQDHFQYKRQMQLMLEKIILVKNQDAIVSKGNTSDPLMLNTENLPDYVNSYTLDFKTNGGFYNEYGKPTIKLNNESGVYDVHDFQGFDYTSAVKVVDLGYNYNLAVKDHTNINNSDETKSKGSPGTIECSKNPNAGKLCLKSVAFLGRDNFDYMPPYQFEYKGEYTGPTSNYIKYPVHAIAQRTEVISQPGSNPSQFGPNFQNNTIMPSILEQTVETPIANIRAKDEWGFLKDTEGQENQVMAAAWTMNKIITPTGASINFEHEEDDYYTEAFSRRYWTENLIFKTTLIGNTIQLEIKNDPGLIAGNEVGNFKDYFSLNDNVFLDLWLCRNKKTIHPNGVDEETGHLDINQNNVSKVTEVTETSVKISTNRIPNGSENGTLWGNSNGIILNNFFGRGDGTSTSGANVYVPKPRNECSDEPCGTGCPDHWSMTYKLLANKVPQDETGGGIRVKSITLKDENGNQYKTRYYYNMLGSGKEKTDPSYKSSGITSYSPVKGTKFIPYQSQLPSPGVMYEYVTMVPEDQNGNNIGETRYRFYTLKPVLNIFDENIEMKDDDGTTIFKANVINDNSTTPTQTIVGYNTVNGEQVPIYKTDYYFNTAKAIKAKRIKLDVNTSLIGQFRSVEVFNSQKQLMSKTQKEYISGYELKARAALASTNANHIDRGSISESFQSMKSIFTTNSSDHNPILKDRFLSISTKEEFSSVLKSIITTGVHGKTVETYSKTDPETGAFLIVETEKADGTKKRVERVPAYKKYPELGSKTTNYNNKHMLSQEAMNIVSVNKTGQWKTINASITSWNNNWTYRDDFGNEETPTQNNYKIWRKHKSYIWKEPINEDGSQVTTLTENSNYFDWQNNNPLSNKWLKASEITRYNHFSSPIETKDINGNFASSKMAENQNKVIVSGNSRYTEMYYSGAEYDLGHNSFDGEVLGADFRTDEVAHTGKYAVKTEDANSKVFEINGASGSDDYYTNGNSYSRTFRPGKYKVSFWGLNENGIEKATKLIVNGQTAELAETVEAGCWKQFNYYIDIPLNTINTIYLVNSNTNENSKYYYDDFRMHPIASSINSFVYDQKTDELVSVLDANNMGSTFKYDNAGRLQATYIETENSQSLNGGFKITSQYKQKYKGSNDVNPEVPAIINNCLATTYQNMEIAISEECNSTFENRFKTTVTGGSGNFTYQYKWLVNHENQEFTNYSIGNSVQFIPNAIKMCEGFDYDKIWSFKVKVTDVNTNQVLESEYAYQTSDCQFNIRQWADLEITKCNTNCGTNKYSFRVHLKDISRVGNFIYEYAYYNPNLPLPQQNFINVTNTNGKFCPNWSMVADPSCPTGYRDYVNLAYRITDLSTNTSSAAIQAIFLGDCTDSGALYPIVVLPEMAGQYLKEGSFISIDNNGEVIEVKNANKVVR